MSAEGTWWLEGPADGLGKQLYSAGHLGMVVMLVLVVTLVLVSLFALGSRVKLLLELSPKSVVCAPPLGFHLLRGSRNI